VSVEVRRATLADVPAIAAFIAYAYAELAPYKGPDRWKWQYQANPSLAGESGVPVWIAVDGDKVVGQLALQASEVKIGDQTRRGGWLVDVLVDPDYRGQGLGHRLQAAMNRDAPLILTLTMAVATRRMAERMGAVTLGPTRQLSRWERPKADDVRRYLVQRTEHRPPLARLVAASCRFGLHHLLAGLIAVLLLFRPAPPVPAGEPMSLEETDRFGPEVDALWNSAKDGYAAICPRTSAWLNWRFVDCPQLNYRRVLLRRGGRLVGYSVLRLTEAVELRQGVIVDLFAARDDRAAFEALIAHALAVFKGKVASVECATSIPEIEAVFRRFGFFVTRVCRPTIMASDEDVRDQVRRLAEQWFFSKADHDWDQIHLG
jgi:GNAT superfamily N-acetyltransferase